MIKLILLGIWCSVAVAGACVACPYFRRTYWTHWYDLSKTGPLEEMDWQQMRKVMNSNPWEHKCRRRWPCRCLCLNIAVSAICVLVFLVGVFLICDPSLFRAVAKGTAGFGVPAALAALGGTAIAVFYNVRLTARAKNRQAWIESVRRQTHLLIANCPSHQEMDLRQSMKNDCDLKMLELLLNPGERVHRSLMAILRLMHRPHDPPLDREALCNLKLTNATGQQGDLKVKATRLANLLLKREWEQVKHVT